MLSLALSVVVKGQMGPILPYISLISQRNSAKILSILNNIP